MPAPVDYTAKLMGHSSQIRWNISSNSDQRAGIRFSFGTLEPSGTAMQIKCDDRAIKSYKLD